MTHINISVSSVFVTAAYGLGVFCALFALWRSRTEQGAAAWIVGLVSFPFVAVPLFVVFGRNKFIGYVKKRDQLDKKAQAEMNDASQLYACQVEPRAGVPSVGRLVEFAKQPGYTVGNTIELLIDGQQTYDRMFAEIETAKKYVIVQFYIFRMDGIGTRFVDLLAKKKREGVQIYFLYDQIGSSISRKSLRHLRKLGIEVGMFHSSKGFNTRFQINFRNHRKIVVIDGHTAFTGGLNVGDDYLGLWPKVGPWRDTHTVVKGPAALAIQLAFVKDWLWATGVICDLDWSTRSVAGGSELLVLHTGPADDGEVCLLAHLALINTATSRVWIANPYFVPPESLMNALLLAAQRGVDVRVLLPSVTDSHSVVLASEVYQERLLRSGVKLSKYVNGFLHQKTMLIDNRIAVVGSANLDPRSMFINFEIFAVSPDPHFVGDVESMLSRDFEASQTIRLQELIARPIWRQFIARAAGLFAPML